MTYDLIYGDNIELRDAKIKASYANKEDAIRALYTEIALAKAQHNIGRGYVRFTMFDGFVSVDFGSWSDFIGLTNVTMDDLN